MFHALRPVMAIGRRFGPGTLEDVLLARHAVIDERLTAAVEDGRVSQVVEIAAGMSPRGYRFAQEHGDRLTYVEADLPGMAARKRSALATLGPASPHHRIVDIDALRDEGAGSLPAVVSELDPARGLAIITEGLLNYLPREDVEKLWVRIAHTLRGFEHGIYLSDLHLASENDGRLERYAMAAVGPFVRGHIHLHFTDVDEAEAALRTVGFDRVELHHPPGFAGVRVVEVNATPR